jgi:hypothetical protein
MDCARRRSSEPARCFRRGPGKSMSARRYTAPGSRILGKDRSGTSRGPGAPAASAVGAPGIHTYYRDATSTDIHTKGGVSRPAEGGERKGPKRSFLYNWLPFECFGGGGFQPAPNWGLSRPLISQALCGWRRQRRATPFFRNCRCCSHVVAELLNDDAASLPPFKWDSGEIGTRRRFICSPYFLRHPVFPARHKSTLCSLDFPPLGKFRREIGTESRTAIGRPESPISLVSHSFFLS